MRQAPMWILFGLALLPLLGGAVLAGSGVRIAAHRGGALLWPENSLLAYRNALALGVEDVETDVHLTADGEVVVLHDPTLDRTTTGRGPVRDRTLAELAAVRLRDVDGRPTDEPLPTLDQLLALLAPTGAGLLLEIKVGADRRPYPEIEERTLALVRARGLMSRVLFMAFEPATVRRLRELDPAARTILLAGRSQVLRKKASPVETVRWATDLGATGLGLDHRLIDAGVVAAARRAGLLLSAWTVNDEPAIRRVLDLGVDGVTTDRPDLARRVLGR